MKKCPECNRTYADETLSFCLADGALLSAPYNPEETQAPTLVLNDEEIGTKIASSPVPEQPINHPVAWYFYLLGFLMSLTFYYLKVYSSFRDYFISFLPDLFGKIFMLFLAIICPYLIPNSLFSY